MTAEEFEKWVQDGVTGRLAKESSAGGPAVEQARQAIAHAAKDPELWKDPQAAVGAVCRGTMRGLLLIDQDPSAVVVPLLKAVGEAAQDCHLDPGEALSAALAGIAVVAVLLPAEQQNAARVSIDEAFMDMGAVFATLCNEAASGHLI